MIPLVPRKPVGRRNSKGVLPTSTAQPSAEVVSRRRGKGKGRKADKETWRRYGINRRRQLLEQDAADGGNCFELNYNCRVQGYFALAEKIISKFNDAFANGTEIEATYVMGNRLCHFLTEALPRHPTYMKKDPLISRLREKSFQSLVGIKKKIEALALRIDEEQLNQFIMNDFDPFADDDDSTASSAGEADNFSSGGIARKEEPQWEDFDGWSFDLPDKMTQVEKNPEAVEFAQDVSLLVSKDVDESGETEDTSNETFSSSEPSFEAHDEHEPIYDSYGADFLKHIASQDVRYETDSEAADSWAQEAEADMEMYSSFSLGDTCDPARIALRELMINKRLRPDSPAAAKGPLPFEDEYPEYQENQSLSFDLSPDNSFDGDDEQEDIWIAFDPTKSLAKTPAELERVSL
ncbi:expressed unknown protein [Seminavis robusta]|uniref:Uncharacterized protein n=1 Tax=Seminavis robusta TaxID=568900 RepID=A0A9N8EEN7_9STRA|nr:expressed unknown protein [Seminavis robusta]|eukprot:Sro827_g207870.1 n/a (407) ;mRNA; r:31651-32940